MQQKVIQIGNSTGVVIPQPIATQTGIKPGVSVNVEKRGDKIVVSKASQKDMGGVNIKFMKMIEDFMNEHDDVLKELSKR